MKALCEYITYLNNAHAGEYTHIIIEQYKLACHKYGEQDTRSGGRRRGEVTVKSCTGLHVDPNLLATGQSYEQEKRK